MPNFRTRRGRGWVPALLAMAIPVAAGSPARAQPVAPPPLAVAPILRSPTPFRVYQRDRDGLAEIPVELDKAPEGLKVVGAEIVSVQGQPVDDAAMGVRFEDGKLVGVPVGGPMLLTVKVAMGEATQDVQVPNVYVGDLWVLAGQSNMEGVGNLLEVQPPDPQVLLLGSDGRWGIAREPLHWLVDSPDAVHSGDPSGRAERSAREHKTRTKGAGLGLAFGSALTHATNVPVGLIACAHGGTSMGQWSPAKRGEGGGSLYGSMLRQVNLAGGRVKGVLWYQGESDANPNDAPAYAKTFADFITAVRDDLRQPELPFYYVQIGRFINGGDPKHWDSVRDDQRRLVERLPNTAVVTGVDLELDDFIHVGTQGLKRLGKRLAKVALREVYGGQAGATTPTLDRVNKGAGNTLILKFKDVNMAAPNAQGRSSPMGGGMGVMNGMMGGMPESPGQARTVRGLEPDTHVAGFSVRKEDGTEIPLIFEAAVGPAQDTVVLKLGGPVPEKAFLWYGHGYNPFCNLTDAQDMAVPAFGPIPLDDLK